MGKRAGMRRVEWRVHGGGGYALSARLPEGLEGL